MFIISVLLSIQGIPSICREGEGCDIVKTSHYAQTFGIYNAYYGVAIFALLIIVSIMQHKKPSRNKKLFLQIAAIIGSLTAIRFIYIQAYILKAYCTYCMIVDTLMIVTTLFLLFWKE
jgi:uncharacterized membrane protein